jgi:hypothetical protein
MADFYQTSGRAGRDGLPSFSLAYTSAAEMSSVRYLVTLDKSRNNNSSHDDVDLNETQQQERINAKIGQLGVVLDYLHSAKCRRAKILDYFGETMNGKKSCKSCDYCCNPRLVQRLINQSGAADIERTIGKGRPQRENNFYPKDEDPELIANTSDTGNRGFKSSREVLQMQMEERISKRLKIDSIGGGGGMAVAAVPAKDIDQAVREKSVNFLERAIKENLEHFKQEIVLEQTCVWAVKEENRIYAACKKNPAAYKARVISTGSGLRQKIEQYRGFVKK